MFNPSSPQQEFMEGPQASSNVWWNMFMEKGDPSTGLSTNGALQKLGAVEPTESASSARSSLLFPESMRASSSSSEDMEEEADDVDSENASTTTDTSSNAAHRRRDSQKRGLGGSRGGTITALSGATLLLEAETDGEEGESSIADITEASGGMHIVRPSSSVWSITQEQRRYYLREFGKLQPNFRGLIPGLLAKQYFLRSELPNQVLAEIWAMSDLDADGALNMAEFCCAMHLVVAVRNGVNLPSVLPAELLQSALQVADRVAGEQLYAASHLSAKKSGGEKAPDSTLRPAPVQTSVTSDVDNILLPVSGHTSIEPWPTATTESITDANQQSLGFPSAVPSRASSMASNLASFDDRPPASALYPFAVRPAPVLPAQIPPPPPPRRPPQQQVLTSSPPMPSNPSTLGVTSLLTSQAVSASASSLQPLLPINDSASITSATSDSSQLQLLVPPLEQLRSRNQQLALRYRELLTELERIRLERTTLQTRLKQFRMSGANGSHRHNAFLPEPAVIATNAIGDREMKNN